MVVLPAPEGPTMATRSPGATANRQAVAGRNAPGGSDRKNARRAMPRAPRGGLGKRLRDGRRADRRLGCRQFEQAFGGAGRQLNLAPHFRQRAERRSGEHRIDDELAERAAGEAAGRTSWAPNQRMPTTAPDGDEDDGAGQEARARRCGRGRPERRARWHRQIAGGIAAPGTADCDRLDVGRGLLGERGRAGKRVLGLARQPPDLAAEQDQRQHDERNGEEDEARQAAGWSPASWRWRRSASANCAARSRRRS